MVWLSMLSHRPRTFTSTGPQTACQAFKHPLSHFVCMCSEGNYYARDCGSHGSSPAASRVRLEQTLFEVWTLTW